MLSVLGISPPVLQPKANEPFPCRFHHCGCLDAEMCRTACGCFKKSPVQADADLPPCCATAAVEVESACCGPDDSQDGYVPAVRRHSCHGSAETLAVAPPTELRWDGAALQPVRDAGAAVLRPCMLPESQPLDVPSPPPRRA